MTPDNDGSLAFVVDVGGGLEMRLGLVCPELVLNPGVNHLYLLLSSMVAKPREVSVGAGSHCG